MTDVFLSYAREDRERVRRLSDALLASGFDVWWDPSEPRFEQVEDDTKLQSAACVLVVWSNTSRRMDYVRSEAATGLYRNKLVQVSIDGTAPPRPFDQLATAELAAWRGDRENPEWRKLTTAIRMHVGTPADRPQPKLKIPRRVQPPKERGGFPVAQLVGVLILLVGGVAATWAVDPFGWRAMLHGVLASPANATKATPRVLPAAPGADIEAAERAWASVDRKDAAALRDYLADHPKSSGAEAAKSLLRVLDAQAWADAVSADTEAAYNHYLSEFPLDAAFAGAKAGEAQQRIGALGGERSNAVKQVQRGLSVLGLYAGEIDGKVGKGTQAAAQDFAQRRKITAIDLATEAPAELYAFADLVGVEARNADRALTAEARPPT